jgi:hypothetical protein
MLYLIGRQDVTFALGDALDVVVIIIVGGQVNALAVFVQTADLPKAVLAPEDCRGILTDKSQDKLLLTLHGVESDFLKSIPDYLAISPT